MGILFYYHLISGNDLLLKDSNEKYDIADDNLLEMIVDNFFENKQNSKIDHQHLVKPLFFERHYLKKRQNSRKNTSLFR